VFSALLVLSAAPSFFLVCRCALVSVRTFFLVLSFKNYGVKLMEDGGNSGWIEQTDDGHLNKKKKQGCLSGPFRSESSSPGRAISYSWRAAFGGCITQGRKTAKGPKNRI
jgi:hypothetical protein